jgi:hypothetical protein
MKDTKFNDRSTMYSLISFCRSNKSKVYVILSKWLFKKENTFQCYWPGADKLIKYVKQNIDSQLDWVIEEVELKSVEFGKETLFEW